MRRSLKEKKAQRKGVAFPHCAAAKPLRLIEWCVEEGKLTALAAASRVSFGNSESPFIIND
jgi:hypothetical protein